MKTLKQNWWNMIRMNEVVVFLKYAKSDIFPDNRKHKLCERIKTIAYLCPATYKKPVNVVILQIKLGEKSVFNVNLWTQFLSKNASCSLGKVTKIVESQLNLFFFRTPKYYYVNQVLIFENWIYSKCTPLSLNIVWLPSCGN